MTPNLPVGGNDILALDGGAGRLLEDQTLVTFGGSYTYLGSGRTGSEQASAAVPVIHVVQTTLAARHHFGEGWSVRASLPMGWISVQTPGYDTNQGYVSAGRYTELAGFGDLDLAAGYDLAALWGVSSYRPRLLLQAGLAFPTGEQNKDSVQLSASPNVLSLGTGSYSPTFSVTLNQRLGRFLSLGMHAGGRVPLHTNNNGIRMGSMVNGSLSLRVLPLSDLTLEAGATVQRVGLAHEEERGEMVNSGGVWLRAVPRVAYRVNDRLSLTAGARIPFFIQVNGTQAVETFAANVGLMVRFGSDKEDKDGAKHDHSAHDQHDHSAHDQRDHGNHDKHDHGSHDRGNHKPEKHGHSAHDHSDHGHGKHDHSRPAAGKHKPDKPEHGSHDHSRRKRHDHSAHHSSQHHDHKSGAQDEGNDANNRRVPRKLKGND